MKKCPYCNKQNSDLRKTCSSCGEEISYKDTKQKMSKETIHKCKKCGIETYGTYTFCSDCNKKQKNKSKDGLGFKRWQWIFYVLGWLFGFSNLIFWLMQVGLHNLKNYGEPFFGKHFHWRVYYWGIFMTILLIFIILGQY